MRNFERGGRPGQSAALRGLGGNSAALRGEAAGPRALARSAGPTARTVCARRAYARARRRGAAGGGAAAAVSVLSPSRLRRARKTNGSVRTCVW